MQARRPTRVTSRAVAILGALALLLAACAEREGALSSPSGPASAQTTTTTPTTATVSAAPASAPADRTPSPSSGGVTMARLEVTTPRQGQTITLPAQIQYRITGVAIPSGAV